MATTTTAIDNQKVAAPEMFVEQAVPAVGDVPAMAHGNPIASVELSPDYAVGHSTEELLRDLQDAPVHQTTRGEVARLLGVILQSEILAKQRYLRVAFKVKGVIFFFQIADILAVQASGNYVSLRHRTGLYLVRESISSLADKLKPYGFIRIHRSVLVNSSLVEEIQPLPTGEYRLRIQDGKEYMLTRTYKNNVRYLAHLWLGPEHLCS